MAKALARDLGAEQPAQPKGALEVHTGPPTPTITAPPSSATEEPSQPSPALPSTEPAQPDGLPGLAPPTEEKPRPALAPITVDNNPMARAAKEVFELGADSWGRTLKRPQVGAMLKPYGEAWGIGVAEWYREKFGDGPIDRNKLLVAGGVVAAGGIVEPFFAPKPKDEAQADEPARPAASAPHAPPISQPMPEDPEDDGPIAVAPLGTSY